MKRCLYKFCVLYITGLCWGLCVSSVVMSIFDFFFWCCGFIFLFGCFVEFLDWYVFWNVWFCPPVIWWKTHMGFTPYWFLFLGPTEDHVYHPKNGCFVELLDWYVFWNVWSCPPVVWWKTHMGFTPHWYIFFGTYRRPCLPPLKWFLFLFIFC